MFYLEIMNGFKGLEEEKDSIKSIGEEMEGTMAVPKRYGISLCIEWDYGEIDGVIHAPNACGIRYCIEGDYGEIDAVIHAPNACGIGLCIGRDYILRETGGGYHILCSRSHGDDSHVLFCFYCVCFMKYLI